LSLQSHHAPRIGVGGVRFASMAMQIKHHSKACHEAWRLKSTQVSSSAADSSTPGWHG
jgi:hypothetical protein